VTNLVVTNEKVYITSFFQSKKDFNTKIINKDYNNTFDKGN